MLTHLHIENFTLVDHLALDIHQGMTVITGETGAGKSILLGALGMAVGDRTHPDKVRIGTEKADISATFDISRLSSVAQWLKEQELLQDDVPHECLLRRLITKEGKSKAFINGHPVTLSQLRALGDQLIDIHSQHEHQSLLNKETHVRLIDDFAQHQPLADEVRHAFHEWQARTKLLQERRNNQEEVSARFQLLDYQVSELQQLALGEDELGELESEQRKLTQIESILHGSQQVYALCSDDEQGLRTHITRALQLLRQIPEKDKSLLNAEGLLESAAISIDEATHEIDFFLDTHHPDPERLIAVEDRLSAIYEIARKHRVRPEELPQTQAQLEQELAQLTHNGSSIEELEQSVQLAHRHYQKLAERLSLGRKKAARILEKAVNDQLIQLAMENAVFSIALHPLTNKCTSSGLEEVEFLISTNLGQLPKPLAKIASGGELSRISLAIQVATAQTSTTPTLVFDEVDVGIGGATGEVVGKLLRELGTRGQVLCVTHLAQVASLGHHHLQVVKSSTQSTTASKLQCLSEEERVTEIARMMGGITLTEQTLAHAREMLLAAH